jgi:hypothetical protein
MVRPRARTVLRLIGSNSKRFVLDCDATPGSPVTLPPLTIAGISKQAARMAGARYSFTMVAVLAIDLEVL